uniref:Alpha-tubulin N-acetyltransferase n=1 Tax=Palpitomonas bilix TaxID=652834 RepID=A0A7S3G4C9_9EUKA|mmetsp:Transcript_20829/g.53749  ORF Transcript_20829/g.53749 Transcript_20829/m.53749 type:complete len:405 (+) Transcript_20829:108-1322(+)
MDFKEYRFQPLFRGKRIAKLDAATYRGLNREQTDQLDDVLDKMGMASKKAQKLPKAITSGHLLRCSDHTVYICVQNKDRTVLGFIKMGKKTLFIRDDSARFHEIKPMCVLDFYVHESMQRKGIGKKLFLYMLQCEGKQPHQLAYDRPSPKLLAFLAKHFNLKHYTPQENNYVVYKQYFTGGSQQQEKSGDQRFIPVSKRPLSSRGRSANRKGSSRGGLSDDQDGGRMEVMPSLDAVSNSSSSPSEDEVEEEDEEDNEGEEIEEALVDAIGKVEIGTPARPPRPSSGRSPAVQRMVEEGLRRYEELNGSGRKHRGNRRTDDNDEDESPVDMYRQRIRESPLAAAASSMTNTPEQQYGGRRSSTGRSTTTTPQNAGVSGALQWFEGDERQTRHGRKVVQPKPSRLW